METQNKIRKREIEICQHCPILQKMLKNSNSDGSTSCAKKTSQIFTIHRVRDSFPFRSEFHGGVTSHKDEYYSDYTKAASVARAGASLQPAFSKYSCSTTFS